MTKFPQKFSNASRRRIAAFHAQAESGPHIAAFGRFSAVAKNALDNFVQSRNHVGTTISNSVFGRSKSLTEQVLECHRPLIESRAECNVPRDTHGDLRLGHVYHFPNREPPHDLVVIDCIEFNERFRYADPISDMAFLVMGLAYQGRRDLTHSFAEAYFSASSDNDGRVLLPLHVISCSRQRKSGRYKSHARKCRNLTGLSRCRKRVAIGSCHFAIWKCRAEDLV